MACIPDAKRIARLGSEVTISWSDLPLLARMKPCQNQHGLLELSERHKNMSLYGRLQDKEKTYSLVGFL
jgi:hypothetical protein